MIKDDRDRLAKSSIRFSVNVFRSKYDSDKSDEQISTVIKHYTQYCEHMIENKFYSDIDDMLQDPEADEHILLLNSEDSDDSD